jgi:hypothetical protein
MRTDRPISVTEVNQRVTPPPLLRLKRYLKSIACRQNAKPNLFGSLGLAEPRGVAHSMRINEARPPASPVASDRVARYGAQQCHNMRPREPPLPHQHHRIAADEAREGAEPAQNPLAAERGVFAGEPQREAVTLDRKRCLRQHARHGRGDHIG